jgi:hypothetical protein
VLVFIDHLIGVYYVHVFDGSLGDRSGIHEMASSMNRRDQFARVLAMPEVDLRRFATYQSLESDWNAAIHAWRAQEDAAAVQMEADNVAAKLAEEQKRSLRARRNSDLLLADDILQQAHAELDNLLHSSSVAQVVRPKRKKDEIPSASHAETILKTSAAPTDVDVFDARLAQVVPASYFSKVEGMLLRLLGEQASLNDNTSGVVVVHGRQSDSHKLASTFDGVSLLSRPREAVGIVLQELTELVDVLSLHHWTPILFHCRAACHYALGNIRLSLKDSIKALDLCNDHHHDSLQILAFRRMLRCHVTMMDVDAAGETLGRIKSSGNVDQQVSQSLHAEQLMVNQLLQLHEACEHKLWSQALDLVNRLCSALPEASPLAEKRAAILVTVDAPDVLDQVATSTLKFPSCSGIWYSYGVLQLQHSSSFHDVECASRSLQRAVSLAGLEGNAAAKQELQKVRYLESKSAMATAYFKSKRWRQAVAELTVLLTISGVSKGLKYHFSTMRAKSFLALGRPNECISDTTYLLNHARGDAAVVDAYVLRSEAHILGQNHDAARRDAQCAFGLLPNHHGVTALLQKLDACMNEPQRPATPPPQRGASGYSSFRGRQSTSPPEHTPSPPPRPNPTNRITSVRPVPIPPHYHILGVAVDATSGVVTKAYREAALKWHPDRWTSSSAEEKLQAEDLFKKMNAAYQILTDGELRAAYDREHGVARR